MRKGLVLCLLAVILSVGAPAAGAQAALSFGIHVDDPTGVLPLHVRIAETTGAEALPVRFTWAEAEPAPGRFSLGAQEAVIDAAREAGLKVVGVLTYPEHLPWPTTSSSRTSWPSGHADDWAFFIARVVSHFRSEIDAWVIEGYREPIEADVFEGAEAEQYALFLQRSAAAIRRNAAVPVLATAPGTDSGWMQLFAEHGGMGSVDGFALDLNRWPTPPSGLGVLVQQIRTMARQFNASPTLWAWQFGYPTHDGIATDAPHRRGVSEQQQALFLVQSHVRLLATGVAAVFYNGLFDEGPDVNRAGDNFGMYSWQLDPKPSATAYATLTNMLRGLHYARAGDVIGRPVLPPEPKLEQEIDDGAAEGGDESGFGEGARAAGSGMVGAVGAMTSGLGLYASGLDGGEWVGVDAGLAGDVDGENLADGEASSGDGEPEGTEPDLPYHFVFDNDLLSASVQGTGQAVAAHAFTGERGTVIVMWTEPAVGVKEDCRDGCGHVNILPWLHGVPVRAFDMFGTVIAAQDDWLPGSEPIYVELPMEMVP